MRFLPVDLLFVIIFLGLAGGLIYATRLGVLPRRSLPALLGALVGGMGIVVWKDRQARAAHARILELERELAAGRERLERLEKDHDATRREVTAARARYDDEVRAARARIAALQGASEEERRRIEAMTTEEIFAWARTHPF
ncbi:MAG: hypothetical protein KY466_13390 [Gemmatimonadetes bacterium]|nr:hypothetical protein [Gemmatimonadota bacterium]